MSPFDTTFSESTLVDKQLLKELLNLGEVEVEHALKNLISNKALWEVEGDV